MEASRSLPRGAYLSLPPNWGGKILCVPRVRQHPGKVGRNRPFSASYFSANQGKTAGKNSFLPFGRG